MVLIEERTGYLRKFEEGNDFCFLREFLLQNQVEKLTPESSVVHKALFAIASNSISPIKDVLEDYAAKSPTSESQFIYKDLIIFLFICVTKKFGLEQGWLLRFVENRKSEEDEKNSITRTFQNLLKENLESKDNYFEIVIVYKDILGFADESEVILNETYLTLSQKTFPFYDSDFLNLIALKAIDLIVQKKGLQNYNEYKSLKDFSDKFENRIKQISTTLFLFVLVLVFSSQVYIAYKYFWGDESQSKLMEKLLTFVPGIAFGMIGIGSKKKIEMLFQNWIKRFFGKKDIDKNVSA
jgi:hypothetical protein